MKEEQKELKVTYGFWSPAICLRRLLSFITGKRNRGAMVIHYKTLAAYRRLFLPLSGVFSGETTLRRFCKSPKKKRGKVAHRRFYKRRRVPTNAETRDAENNIIFRHTGVSRNAGMSIILIIDIPAFWWNAGMLLFNINFFGVCRNAEKCLKIIKKIIFVPI